MGVGEPAGVSTGAVLGSGVKVARAMGGEGVGGGGVVGVGGAGAHATTKKINAQTNEIRNMSIVLPRMRVLATLLFGFNF